MVRTAGLVQGATLGAAGALRLTVFDQILPQSQGPSGSGKTTLLDLLAGRKTTGKATGDILFAGNRPTRPFLRRYTGYVEQFDTLLPILTVEEMLMYTAELKRPRSESRATKRAAVEVSACCACCSACGVISSGPAVPAIQWPGGKCKSVGPHPAGTTR